MKDLFKRANWKRRAAYLEEENTKLRNQNEYLIRTIRDMDDKIFSMGQHTSWEAMRPRFAALHDEMTARKVAESKAINSIITQRLHEVYTPESAALKQITKDKS